MTIQLENISDKGFMHIIMVVNDIIKSNMVIREEEGLQVGNEWITPESCYWLYKLLEKQRGTCLVDEAVLNALRNGTNNPETLT